MRRRLPIAFSLVALLALSAAAGASAKIPFVPVVAQTMNGSALYGQSKSEPPDFGLFDVLTRQYTSLDAASTGNSVEWGPTVASSYGAATLVSTYTETDDLGVFTLTRISRSGARKNLISYPGESGGCGRWIEPVEISSGGAVRAIFGFLKASGKNCVIDTDRTELREFPVKGKSRRLWLPPKYAALLYGGRLQTSGRWATLESGVSGSEDYEGAMLLDLKAHKKVRSYNPGEKFETVTVRLGADGAAVVTETLKRTRTTTLYSSPRARGKRIAASDRLTLSYLCGGYAATYSEYNTGVFENLTIRDIKGRTRFHLAPPTGQYVKPLACSAKYLLASDATLAPGEGEEVVLGETRLISLRTGREAP